MTPDAQRGATVDGIRHELATVDPTLPWLEAFERSARIIHSASPWPGTAAEVEAVVDETLDRCGVPESARRLARPLLMPAE